MSRDRRITTLVAVATFIGLTAITAVVWAVTRPEAPPSTFERITIEEFKPLYDRGEVVVIDVRASEAYVASHIPNALHIPVTHIESEIQYLAKGKKIVTYCTCPAEESSGDAAMILAKSGFDVKALKGGFEAWTSRGFPTATGVK